MKFETVVSELFSSFPKLEEVYQSKLGYMLDEPPLAYIVFGCILIPELERALREKDTGTIQSICAFLEEMAISCREDMALRGLMEIEVGEWLGFCADEDVLTPLICSQTGRVCKYVPGLATQRRMERGR